jgi:hypothetical protein
MILLRISGFFRTAGKHQVNIETGGGRSAEIQYNWNRFSTNPHSDESESMLTDGDATNSTVLTATIINAFLEPLQEFDPFNPNDDQTNSMSDQPLDITTPWETYNKVINSNY